MTEVRGAAARHRLWQEAGRPAGMWCILINQPGHLGGGYGDVEETEDCQVTVLFRRLDGPEGRSIKRGACLGCEWEGPDRTTINQAIEDAHDHAFPGWRTLPAVVRKPRPDWLGEVSRVYPSGWFQSGGPIITVRGQDRMHHPCAAPGGGYDMASPYEWPSKKKRARRAAAYQPSLLDEESDFASGTYGEMDYADPVRMEETGEPT